ncbi:hypothetical protein [Salmonirosea aquatica]|uniref:Uncharacterized protein n=1 Tax=Salmonirosea aquatica TaxID=2654236 RepID=A0A7C9F2Q0_9BACT|nr:hypothetical protein [Cytophagaceae bacterium SJW1-29]
MKNFICLFVALITAPTWAQKEIAYDSITDIHRYEYRAELYDYRLNGQQNSYRTVAIKGSPFLFNKWQQGSIPYRNNRSLALLINYNVMEDYAVVSLADGEKQIYPESFMINDLTFVRVKSQYYQALYDGKTKLLRRYTARLDPVERNGYNENVQYDYEYTKGDDLFLQSLDGSLVPIKLNERSLLAKLSDQRGARNIVQEQKLNLRSEKDVIALLTKLEQ